MSNMKNIKENFPALWQKVHGKDLVYLDSAATTLKHQSVIDEIVKHYKFESANIHRGVHHLSEIATMKYEQSRQTVQKFLNANRPEEIIFTKGTTESLNLIAGSWGRENIGEGDEIILTEMEHHSNIVPWQMLAQEKGAQIKYISLSDTGDLNLTDLEKLITNKTKLISFTMVSNTLGTINDYEHIIRTAKENGILTVIDGAQAAAHLQIDVINLDCDFFVFSGHKLFGPTGIGVLYGKYHLLESMPPYQGGGSMIELVEHNTSTYALPPARFEAGTPPIAEAISLKPALELFMNIGFDCIQKHESEILLYAKKELSKIPGLNILGSPKKQCSVISFTMEGIHPHDIGTLCDREGVAIRTGHHCTQLIMKRYSVPATSRASFSIYNTKEDVDKLVIALKKTREILQ